MAFRLLRLLSATAARARRFMNRHRWKFCAVALALAVGLQLFAAGFTIKHSNPDWTRADQGAEMWLARTSQYDGDLYPRRSDGVRHPLFSWVSRTVLHEDDAEFFRRGKWLNTWICVVFLVVFGLLITPQIGPLACANVLLLSSLGLLVVRGTYFQPEPLYFIFSFAAMACAWQILQRRGWFWFPLFGVAAGLAYLAKPSFEPFLAAFAGCLLLRVLLDWRAGLRGAAWPLAGGLAAVAIIVLMALPLALYRQQHFGSFTFSYPKFWMWMDDFETEAWPWQDKYSGRPQLASLAPAEIPGPAWYFRRHSPADAVARLTSGTAEVVRRFFIPESKLRWSAIFWQAEPPKRWGHPLSHRGVYLWILGLLAAGCAAVSWKAIVPRCLEPANLACALLVAGVAVGYSFLYGWYYPIGRGDRFMGSLWMPAVFLVCLLGRWTLDWPPRRGKALAYVGVHCAVFVLLLIQAANLVVLFHRGFALKTGN